MENEGFLFNHYLLVALTFLIPLFYLLRFRPICNCEICHDYLTSKWTRRFTNRSDWYTHLLQKSPTRTFRIHIANNIVTANPLNVEYMLKTRFENFPKGKPFSAILGDLLGRGIFNVDGDLWSFQRKMASLEFGSVSVRAFAFPVIMKEIEKRLLPLLDSVSESGEIDLQDVFRRFSFDAVCKISFGLDPCSLDHSIPLSEFAKAFDLASEISAIRAVSISPLIWKMKRALNIGSEKKLRDSIRIINMQAEAVIKGKRKMAILKGPDLLSRFIDSVKDDEYLRDIVKSFLLAGRDTVASALTSFFWLTINHPRVVVAIRNEWDSIMKKDELKLPDFDQIKEMHYLHATLHESMRLYPPIQFDSKFPISDDMLPDGTKVERNSRVTYHPYAMGRMKEIWGEDSEEFKPERWLKKGVFCPENPFKYPVFQGGLRMCLGKEMAIMEIKSVAAAIIRRFDFEVVDSMNKVPRFASGLTANFSGGLIVKVKPRKEKMDKDPTRKITDLTTET